MDELLYEIEEDPEFKNTLIKALKRRRDRLKKEEEDRKDDKNG